MNAPSLLPKHFGPAAVDTYHPAVWSEDDLRDAMLATPPARRNPPMPKVALVPADLRKPSRDRSSYNRNAVLNCIADSPGISRPEITRRTGLSRNSARNALLTLARNRAIRVVGPSGKPRYYVEDQL